MSGCGISGDHAKCDRAADNSAPADHGHAIFLFDCDWGVPFAACVNVRTIARRARSILKALCFSPFAARRNTSAARLKFASLGA